GVGCGRLAGRVGTERLLELGHQAFGRERALQLGVLVVVGAPDLGNVPGDPRADARRPLDAGGGHAGLAGRVPERGPFDVLGIPRTAPAVLSPWVRNRG